MAALRPKTVIFHEDAISITHNADGTLTVESKGCTYVDISLDGVTESEVSDFINEMDYDAYEIAKEAAGEETLREKVLDDMNMEEIIEEANIDIDDFISYFDEDDVAKALSKEVLANTLMGNNNDG